MLVQKLMLVIEPPCNRSPFHVTNQEIDSFREKCRQYYISLDTELIKQFPFAEKDIQLWEALAFLDPTY